MPHPNRVRSVRGVARFGVIDCAHRREDIAGGSRPLQRLVSPGDETRSPGPCAEARQNGRRLWPVADRTGYGHGGPGAPPSPPAVCRDRVDRPAESGTPPRVGVWPTRPAVGLARHVKPTGRRGEYPLSTSRRAPSHPVLQDGNAPRTTLSQERGNRWGPVSLIGWIFPLQVGCR